MKVPTELIQDRYWRGTLHLFSKQSKLQQHFTTKYFDVAECTIDSTGLKRISKSWSPSERFMLALALHMYNDFNKVNMSDMDLLDDQNKNLVFEALRLRFS
ncbi:hypothetical protein [Paenibacillus macquariensis]|uniref:PiggyBac transposable element-derived protein domain-containing protein n=1 Tax=Paenibacillus macquariensis TaxID=948756 RepID=A0ABY1KEV2_9BACL|nr:hypothetical protein [Paenibacillus macquariensis]MEC0092475.1 hypothetical protein [Paenibacillus macquariensis]SIR72662.1 hypothetical protein SAMN05421578_14810 [Paenibacillus macquariensis]